MRRPPRHLAPRRVRRHRWSHGVAALGILGTVVAAPGPALAGEVPTGTVTTSSTKVVSWLSQNPRDPGDGPTHPEVYDKLKNWKLRVSQTADLLNQTVEVSWSGATPTALQTLEVMQCWSDGPDVQPTREQCAYGGIDRLGAEGTGSARTRQLSADPRETRYRRDGDLNVVTVDGGDAPTTWPESSDVVMGTLVGTCPDESPGYTLALTPPDHGRVVLVGPTSTPPAPMTRGSRTYPAVTAPFSLADVASQAPSGVWPDGVYRLALTCDVPGATVAPHTFVGYLEKLTTSTGERRWRWKYHEGGVVVPFDPLGDTPDLGPTDPYERDQILDYVQPRTTNELWQAKSHPDGSGDVFMEVLTDLEAQHLGCGRVDGGKARGCWLVAVPRWTPDPEGSEPTQVNAASPLSQTLWDRRIAVPLAFAPVASGCTIGSGLKQLLAHDSALAALRSWQPTFCGDSSTASSVLGPLQDDAVRNSVSSPNRMGVVTVPPEGVSTLVTAPLTTSGVVVAFSADRRLPYGSDDYAADGTATTLMNLNARLVAKLLSQSYDSGAAPNGGKTSGYNTSVYSGDFQPVFTPARSFPKDNPRTLYDDPEFLRLNPDFASWLSAGAARPPQDMADLLVSANSADAYNVLWRWILGDKDAKAFLDGQADPDGMRVNPYYKGQLTSSLTSFPLLDPTCVDNIESAAGDNFPLLCEINIHPRVDDDGDAAQAAVRGDTKRVNVPPILFTPDQTAYKAEDRQPQGGHGMLVITTSAIAARYGLPTARLRNASGSYVAATAASLAAARDQMPTRSDGVLLSAPAAVKGDGYPLTTMSYAIADVAALTTDQDEAFAKILDYAAGAGQKPGTAIGQLPPGYAPLSTSLASSTRAAAALLRDPSSLLEVDAPTTETPSEAPVVPPTSGQLAGPLVPGLPQVSGQGALPPGAAPSVARSASLTGRVASTLPYLLPGLLLVATTCLVASRVLRNVGGSAPSHQ